MSCQSLMLVQGLRRTRTILVLEAVVMVRSAGLVGRCLLSWPRLPPKKKLLRFCSCLSPVQNRLSLAPYPLKRECQILLKTFKATWETKDVGSALFSNLVQFFPCSTHTPQIARRLIFFRIWPGPSCPPFFHDAFEVAIYFCGWSGCCTQSFCALVDGRHSVCCTHGVFT